MPETADLRYNWVVAGMAALDHDEMTELVTDTIRGGGGSCRSSWCASVFGR